jgi:hypothetical protein
MPQSWRSTAAEHRGFEVFMLARIAATNAGLPMSQVGQDHEGDHASRRAPISSTDYDGRDGARANAGAAERAAPLKPLAALAPGIIRKPLRVIWGATGGEAPWRECRVERTEGSGPRDTARIIPRQDIEIYDEVRTKLVWFCFYFASVVVRRCSNVGPLRPR